MLKFLGKLLDSNEKELKKMAPVVEEINSLELEMKKLKDDEFPAKTASFRERLSGGETIDDLLPEAFAVSREAIRRVVEERAFDVQLMAAMALHQGRVAEQRTGEGKTLSAAMTAYLNGLAGRGVHIVTVNDYLARRDTGWYGQALHFAGLSLGCIIHEQAFLLDPEYTDSGQDDERLRHLRPVPRQEAYLADVTYGTNNEFGFDYLRDNMALRFQDQVQRVPANRAGKHHFAIVDEVDSILIDEARTPLIISAPDTEPTQKYYQFAKMISWLSPDTDYVIDEKLKTANLTEHGLRKVEKRLGIDNLYEKDFDTIHHIENALRSRTLYLRDRDYVVKENQVIIVDEFTGRLMHGRRWSDGLHQAVEAKEGVKIQQESITMATISFQNYFRMYQKLAGMTGTAATEAEEFKKIYDLDVVVVPTNLPMIRKSHADVVYKTTRAKYAAVVREIEECCQKGQPVLVGTTSVEKNEIIDRFLKKKGVPHNVLNAKQHEKEARIIAEAGRKKAVTVATNMAGRGVDIVLGGSKEGRDLKEWQKEHDEVIKLGGLHVIGTERHESRRIDNQLRGRSGRQGDPGSSRFFLALEDDIMRLFGGEQVARLMEMLKIPEDQPIEHGMVSKAIEQAQVKVEGFHFDQRKQVVEYDDVMNKQREIIYAKRKQILEMQTSLESKAKGTLADSDSKKESKRTRGVHLRGVPKGLLGGGTREAKYLRGGQAEPGLLAGGALKEEILEKMKAEADNLVSMYAPEGFEKIEYEQIVNGFCEILPFDLNSQKRLKEQVLKIQNPEKLKEVLNKLLTDAYESREKQVTPEVMREMERVVYLRTIDRLWIDHLDAISHLREGVGLRGYGQKDPLVEYKKEAFASFERLISAIDYEVVRRIFRVQVGRQPMPRPQRIQTNIDQQDGVGLRPDSGQAPLRPDVTSGLRRGKKIGRNDPCPCGAGEKYKKCCYPKYG